MPTIDFERLDWEDYPSTETPLSAENLNRLEDAMEGIYDDVGGQEEAISNILGNFAYVEPTSTASKDYLAGDLLVRGDYMYKAIIPIQTDDALVEGTNITKTTVSSELGVDVFSNFAYIERSNVATKNYTVGSHVLLNNILYVVTSAVETGENLVVDMNIEQTTVCDELEKETGSVASAVGYDNTNSGLTATNVQDALDEVSNAEGVSYDNTESGLTATNVQDALDEIDSAVGAVDTAVTAVNSRCDEFYKIAFVESPSYDLSAGLHANVTISHSYGNKIRGAVVYTTPNAAHVFANIHAVGNSTITVGYYNSAGVVVSGIFRLMLFLYSNR